MKKLILTAIIASVMAFSLPQKAEAFLLPPFKTDFVNSIKKTFTSVKSWAINTYKKVEQSTFIQTTIQYGKGAKEALDYAKSISDYKNLDADKIASLATKFKKIDKKKAETKDKAAQDAANVSSESNKKIAEIDKNIEELNKDTLAHPENAKNNTKKIAELQKKRAEITSKTYQKIHKIVEDSNSLLSTFDDSKAKLMEEFKPIKSLVALAKNYDSTENLKDTLSLLSPKKETKVTNNIVYAYREVYYSLYWADLNEVIKRNTIIRSGLLKDNETTTDKKEKSAEMEGSTAAKSVAAIDIKKSNMMALLNYTDLILQDLKLQISHDLAFSPFSKINADTSISNFNFDNYKLNPETDKYEVETTPATQFGEDKAIEEGIEAPSEAAVEASEKAIAEYAQQEKEAQAKAEAEAEKAKAEAEKAKESGGQAATAAEKAKENSGQAATAAEKAKENKPSESNSAKPAENNSAPTPSATDKTEK